MWRLTLVLLFLPSCFLKPKSAPPVAQTSTPPMAAKVDEPPLESLTAPETMASDTKVSTKAGTNFQAPGTWIVQTASARVVLTAPEKDLHAYILDVDAANADEAIARAERYLQTNARDPQMRFLVGVALNQKGDVAAAQDTFSRLTQEFPELPEPHNNLAVIHAAAGRYDEARIALEAAIRANPQYAVALENLGDVHARLAQRAWQRAQAIDTGNPRLEPKLKAVQGLLDQPANTPPR